MDLQKIGLALSGFGAGVQGQGTQFLQQLQEQKKNEALSNLGNQYAQGQIDQTQYLKGLAKYDPTLYGKMALANVQQGTPAVLQVNNKIDEALKGGDYDTANRLFALARSGAYGVDTYGPQNNPYGSIPGQANTGGGVAQQIAANAGLKKGAETQAQKDVELTMEPKITYQTQAAQIAANLEGDKKKEYNENLKVSPLIADLYALNENSPDMAYAGVTQPLRRLVPGTSKGELAIDRMQQLRLEVAAPLAKQLGVNPTDKDFQASLDRIFDIEASKESRKQQIQSIANRIKRRQAQLSGSPEAPTEELDLNALLNKYAPRK